MRIFISYGHDEHLELARRLKDDLKTAGHEVWFDEDCLYPGFDWESYIEHGLAWCSAEREQGRVVFLMTPHAIRRPNGYCLNELARALHLRLLVVPVMVIWCEPPLSICRIQWLDMRDCVPVEDHRERYEQKRDRLIQALEKGDLDFEGTQSLLFRYLQPLDFAADIAEHLQHFVGRDWIIDRVHAWLHAPHLSRIFWIVGPPGVGKTAIASYLCHRFPEVVAFHFCRYGHDEKSDPKRCVLSLAYQLTSQFPEYLQRIAPLISDLNRSAATLFDALIIQPLAHQSRDPGCPILLVIDGLDEATHHGRNELAELLASELPRTPSWLRLLVTSRPEHEIAQPFQGISPYYLDADSSENRNDIRLYIQKLLPSSSVNNSLEEQAITSIVDKSEGLFLYAQTVIAELKLGERRGTRPTDFPQGLGGIFFSFFTRRFSETSIYKKRYRPLLEMVAAARGPLPLNIAKTALKWTPYECTFDDTGEASGTALAPLRSMFPQTDGTIRPFHHAIIEWLTDSMKAGAYFADIGEGNRRLAETCWAEYKTASHIMSAYAAEHLPTHLMKDDRWEDLLELVMDPTAGLMTRWTEGGEGARGLPCLLGLIAYLEKGGREAEASAALATQISRIYGLWGQYEDSERWLNKAIAGTSWIRGRRVRAVALHELGSLALYRDDLRAADRSYTRALHLCRYRWPCLHDEAAANLAGLSIVAFRRYLFIKAISLAEEAKREAKLGGDIRHFIAGERLVATGYKALGRFAEAEMHIENALRLAEGHSLHMEKTRLLLLKGWLQYDQATINEFPDDIAVSLFKEGMEIAQRTQNRFCILDAALGLGWAALSANATTEAESWLTSFLATLPSGLHPELQAGICTLHAALAHQRAQRQTAEDLYDKAISFCQENGVHVWLSRALVGFGAVLWHNDEPKEALEYWERALNVALKVSPFRRTLTQASIESCKKKSTVTPR